MGTWDFLLNLVGMAPTLIVYTAGVVAGIVRWRRHPRVSMLVIVSCGFLAIYSMAAPVLLPSLLGHFDRYGSYGWFPVTVVHFVLSAIPAVGFAALIWAAFAGRRPHPRDFRGRDH